MRGKRGIIAAWLAGAIVGVAVDAPRAIASPDEVAVPAPDDHALAAELARAVALGRALVVRFTSAGCEPCAYLEDQLLPRADVQAALRGVTLVTYDLDEPLGRAAARRLEVTGTPSLLVLEPDGRPSARVDGLPARAPGWLLAFLADAATPRASAAALRAAVAAAPDDAAARLALAAHLRATAATSAALAQYRAVVASPAAAADQRAVAAHAVLELDGAELRLADAIARARTFVEAHAGAAATPDELMFLAASGRVPRPALRTLAEAHLAAAPADRWPDAIRALALLGGDLAARQAIDRAIASDADAAGARLLRIELELLDEVGWRTVWSELTRACEAPTADVAAWCLALESSVIRRRELAPAMAELQALAEARVEHLARPGASAAPRAWWSAAGDGGAFASALAIGVRRAGARCAGASSQLLLITMRPSSDGGRPRDVEVHARGDGRAQAGCVTRALEQLELPAPPPGVGSLLFIEHAIRGLDAGTGDRRGAPSEPPVGHAALLGLAQRVGAVPFSGLAADALLDVAPLADFRFVLGVDGELGAAAGALAGAAHGKAGLVISPRPGHTLRALVGVGVGRRAPDAPLALEVPVELRLHTSVRQVRLAAWARSTFVARDAARAAASSAGALGGDELSVGAGVFAPVAARRVFVGVSVDGAAGGWSTTLYAALALGRQN